MADARGGAPVCIAVPAEQGFGAGRGGEDFRCRGAAHAAVQSSEMPEWIS